MGLFDFLKPKPTNNGQLQKKVEVIPADKNLYLLEALKAILIEMGYQVERHPQYLSLIINTELEVSTMIVENPGTHPSVLHLMVAASHPQYFPNGIIENVVGVGITLEEQVNAVLGNYINSTFLTLIDSLSDTHNPELDFTRSINSKEVLWHPKLGKMNFQGLWQEYPQYEYLFEILKDKIPAQLTDNKLNWLKIYISKRADGQIIGECLFNNVQWETGYEEIYKYAKSWNLIDEFRGIKQFIVFRRCDLYDVTN